MGGGMARLGVFRDVGLDVGRLGIDVQRILRV